VNNHHFNPAGIKAAASSSTPGPFASVASLRSFLGDCEDADNLFSNAQLLALDEAEQLPSEQVQALLDRGVAAQYVPRAWGGQLDNYQELYELAKVLAGRDLTTAIAMSTMVWSTAVWIGGSDAQKARCAHIIQQEGGFHCLAYSERDHGADLIAGDLTASADGDEYLLNGEKWPINRATHSRVIVLLAKTAPDRGARGLSLFMIDKHELSGGGLHYLPKARTLGIRGCDISGLRFTNARIPASCRIGAEGEGLDIALKAFQITRALCAGLSVGITGSACDIVERFAGQRRLYGKTLASLPWKQRQLQRARADINACDWISHAMMRILHVMPGCYGLYAAALKAYVPVRMDQTLKQLSVTLGARFFLRDEQHLGAFGKKFRDAQVIPLFDGSTDVNLYTLSSQLPSLMKRQKSLLMAGPPPMATAATRQPGVRAMHDAMADLEQTLAKIFSLRAPVPPCDYDALRLTSKGRDPVMESLPLLLRQLAAPANSQGSDWQPTLQLLRRRHGEILVAVASALDNGCSIDSVEMMDCAFHYTRLLMAVSFLWCWYYNGDGQGSSEKGFSEQHFSEQGLFDQVSAEQARDVAERILHD